MMKARWKAFLWLMLVLALIVVSIWALINLIGLQASIIWTAIIGAMGWAVQSAVRQKQEYQRLLSEQKRKQYFEFLDFLNEFSSASFDASQPMSPDRLLQLRRWSLRLTMIGSDDVVKAWNRARSSSILERKPENPDDQTKHTLTLLTAWGMP